VQTDSDALITRRKETKKGKGCIDSNLRKFRKTDVVKSVRTMPGITAEAADWLGRARAIAGVGTECPSIGKPVT
jgi:kynurenine formamidase